MTQEVNGILGLWKTYFKMMRDLESLRQKKDKLEEYDYTSKSDALIEMSNQLMETIQAQLDELRRYKEINEKYNEIQRDIFAFRDDANLVLFTFNKKKAEIVANEMAIKNPGCEIQVTQGYCGFFAPLPKQVIQKVFTENGEYVTP